MEPVHSTVFPLSLMIVICTSQGLLRFLPPSISWERILSTVGLSSSIDSIWLPHGQSPTGGLGAGLVVVVMVVVVVVVVVVSKVEGRSVPSPTSAWPPPSPQHQVPFLIRIFDQWHPSVRSHCRTSRMIESCQAVQGIFSPATPTCSQGASWTTDNYMPGPWQEKYEKTFQSISVTHNNAPAGNSRLKLNSNNNQRFLRKIIFFFGKNRNLMTSPIRPKF